MQEHFYPDYADDAWIGYEDFRDYIERIIVAADTQEAE